MELDSLDGEGLVTQAHDDFLAVVVGGPRAYFQFAGQRLFADDQRVVAGRSEGRVKSLKNCAAVVRDLAGFTVH